MHRRRAPSLGSDALGVCAVAADVHPAHCTGTGLFATAAAATASHSIGSAGDLLSQQSEAKSWQKQAKDAPKPNKQISDHSSPSSNPHKPCSSMASIICDCCGARGSNILTFSFGQGGGTGSQRSAGGSAAAVAVQCSAGRVESARWATEWRQEEHRQGREGASLRRSGTNHTTDRNSRRDSHRHAAAASPTDRRDATRLQFACDATQRQENGTHSGNECSQSSLV